MAILVEGICQSKWDKYCELHFLLRSFKVKGWGNIRRKQTVTF